MDLNHEELNPQQKKAATSDNRHILVIAGAGTGKTKTLTHRIAHLLNSNKATGKDILALTFTNKAAAEMHGRLTTLTGPARKGIKVSTFHAYCLTFLKQYAKHAQLRPNFLIYDAADQLETANDIFADLGLKDIGLFNANGALMEISKAKNTGKSAADFYTAKHHLKERLLGKFYEAYNARLRNYNAVDFDDLLLLTLEVLKAKHEDVKINFRHILIDEYQDTNQVQYELLKHLAGADASVFAVGDDDQSIYSWRGANIKNILNFREDYPDSEIIMLTQNYRSTDRILNLSNAIIGSNSQRFDKKLFSSITSDSPPVLYEAGSEDDEMQTVITGAKAWCANHRKDWSSVAFIYRSNYHSRKIEEALRNEGIAYKLVGGTNFFAREEVKTALSYLRLIINPHDNLSFQRAVKFPARGVGDKTLSRLNDQAQKIKSGMFEAIPYLQDVSKSSVQALHAFKDTIENAKQAFERQSMFEAAKSLYDTLGFEQAIARNSANEDIAEKKIKNFRELLQSIFIHQRRRETGGLRSFLDYTMLFQTKDDNQDDKNKAILMTVHMAKGLEFECVCLCGLTDDSFPNSKAVIEGLLEEERRLFYVAITRAKRMLFLSYPKKRTVYGKIKLSGISRFLSDLPAGLLSTNVKGKGLSAEETEKQRLLARERFFNRLEEQKNQPKSGIP